MSDTIGDDEGLRRFEDRRADDDLVDTERTLAVPSVDPDPELPEIPSVEVRREIGRGGMGVVYEARQTFLERDVAVKVLRGGSDNPEFGLRFQREAKLLALLSHPNVVSCYHAGTLDSGQNFLVMEFIDGPNIDDYVRENGPLTVKAALSLCREVASALGYAYAKGLIHRDVKPANVLLQHSRERTSEHYPFLTKLADLGLARPEQLETTDLGLTVPGSLLGSPATMAPEQFSDPDSVDYRADIYGLGCVLYYALTGKRAFPETSLTDLIARKMRADCPDPRGECGKSVSPKLAELVSSMLSPHREKRPQSYAEIVQVCDELLDPESDTPSGPEQEEGRRKLLPYFATAIVLAGASAWAYFGGMFDKDPNDRVDQESAVVTFEEWGQAVDDSLMWQPPELLRVGEKFGVELDARTALDLRVEDAAGNTIFEERVEEPGPFPFTIPLVAREPREASFDETFTLVLSDANGTEKRIEAETLKGIVDPVPILESLRAALPELPEDLSTLKPWELYDADRALKEWQTQVRGNLNLQAGDRDELFSEEPVDDLLKGVAARLTSLPEPILRWSVADEQAGSTDLRDSSGGKDVTLYTRDSEVTLYGEIEGPLSSKIRIGVESMKSEDLALTLTDGRGTFETTVSIPDGRNRVAYVARDERGRLNASLSILRDSTTPTISGLKPLIRARSQALPLSFNCTDDGAGVDMVSWSRKGEEEARVAILQQEDGTWSTSLPLEVGMNEFVVRAHDLVGNVTTSDPITVQFLPESSLSGIDPIMSALARDGIAAGTRVVPDDVDRFFPSVPSEGSSWEFWGTGISQDEASIRTLFLGDARLRLQAKKSRPGEEAGSTWRLAAAAPLPLGESWSLTGTFGFSARTAWPGAETPGPSYGRVALGLSDGMAVVLEVEHSRVDDARKLSFRAYRWNYEAISSDVEYLTELELADMEIPASMDSPTNDFRVDVVAVLDADNVTLTWGPPGTVDDSGDPSAGARQLRILREELGWDAEANCLVVLQAEMASIDFQDFEREEN